MTSIVSSLLERMLHQRPSCCVHSLRPVSDALSQQDSLNGSPSAIWYSCNQNSWTPTLQLWSLRSKMNRMAWAVLPKNAHVLVTSLSQPINALRTENGTGSC